MALQNNKKNTKRNTIFRKEGSLDKIAVPTLTGLIFLEVSQIIFCKASDNYTELYLTDNRKAIVVKTLKLTEEYLEARGFIRIHRTYLINMVHAQEYLKSGGEGGVVIMSGQQKLPIARSRKLAFIHYLRDHNMLMETYIVQ